MHGVIEGLESRVFGKEGFEAQRVRGREIVLSFTQGSQGPAMVLANSDQPGRQPVGRHRPADMGEHQPTAKGGLSYQLERKYPKLCVLGRAIFLRLAPIYQGAVAPRSSPRAAARSPIP